MFTFSLCKYCHHPILCDYKEVEIIGAGSYGFKLSVSSFMDIYGYLSLMLFEINKSSFWVVRYFVSTVVLNTKTMETYLRNQEEKDMLQDNSSKKEYENSFKVRYSERGVIEQLSTFTCP